MRSWRSARRVALATACTWALLPGVPAQARIVPGKGIAGIRLGMSMAAVLQRLGEPSTALQPFPGYSFWSYTRRHLFVQFVPRDAPLSPAGGVFAVVTRSRRERTRGDLGVGSARTTVRARMPHLRCPGPNKFGIDRGCYVRKHGVTTSFSFAHGRVDQVEIGHYRDHPAVGIAGDGPAA
jgi:hypothetical protein